VRFLDDFANKADALARRRANEALLLTAITDYLACRVDVAVQGGIGNEATAPHGCDQVTFANHTVAIFDQIGQQIEYLRSNRDKCVAVAAELTALFVQPKMFKQIQHVAAPQLLSAELYRRAA